MAVRIFYEEQNKTQEQKILFETTNAQIEKISKRKVLIYIYIHI